MFIVRRLLTAARVRKSEPLHRSNVILGSDKSPNNPLPLSSRILMSLFGIRPKNINSVAAIMSDYRADLQPTNQSNKHSNVDSANSGCDDDEVYFGDDEDTLKEFETAYNRAREGMSSQWLDYRRSCYVYLYQGGGSPNEVLAGFDLDGTIIKPKSNKKIPRSATDWDFFSVWTKTKISQAISGQGARFVMFTNQNGVGLQIVPLEEVQERIELVTKRLNIPCTVFVATEKDAFRKPKVGMFRLFEKSFNGSQPINLEKSFYCGDAVGYPSHSDADIKFAQKLGLPFLAPEKFLRGVKPKLVSSESTK